MILLDVILYKGDTPDIKYYKNVSVHNYDKLYKSNWSFKNESIEYLKDDLNSLYQVIVKANRQL